MKTMKGKWVHRYQLTHSAQRALTRSTNTTLRSPGGMARVSKGWDPRTGKRDEATFSVCYTCGDSEK